MRAATPRWWPPPRSCHESRPAGDPRPRLLARPRGPRPPEAGVHDVRGVVPRPRHRGPMHRVRKPAGRSRCWPCSEVVLSYRFEASILRIIGRNRSCRSIGSNSLSRSDPDDFIVWSVSAIIELRPRMELRPCVALCRRVNLREDEVLLGIPSLGPPRSGESVGRSWKWVAVAGLEHRYTSIHNRYIVVRPDHARARRTARALACPSSGEKWACHSRLKKTS